jgi:hypothetical protein
MSDPVPIKKGVREGEDMLIYEEDGNILSLSEIIECLFNCLRIRF